MKQLLHSFLSIRPFFPKKNSASKDNFAPAKAQPELILVSHFYEGQSIQVLIQDKKGKKIIHDIQHFARKKELISLVSSKDAFLLGYLLAEDSSARSFQ